MNSSMVFLTIVGEVSLSLETSEEEKEYLLKNNLIAVFAPQASWIKVYDFSKDAVLVGLSERIYVDCHYINDYGRYRELLREDRLKEKSEKSDNTWSKRIYCKKSNLCTETGSPRL